ncbi:MAG: hypothetical protein RBR18_13150 [Desulfovibrionaceae bacterium]|nr:hypothetical protein [Desulfovibrionaceae bacterium]
MQEFIRWLMRMADLVAEFGVWVHKMALSFKQFLQDCLDCPLVEESHAQA